MRKVVLWLGGSALAVGAVVITLAGSLCRSSEMPETPNRIKCTNNLSQIGVAIALYARENGGATPDSFKTLLRKQDLVPEVFICASGSAERAASVDAFADTDKDSSYVYCGNDLPPGPILDDAILALDRPMNHDHDGVNVLFGDGHVEFELIGRSVDHESLEWTSVQDQIARKVRPVRWQRASASAR